ncbi:fibrous sheath CABYR-binding protein [Tachyglossus aculeatus]|uniref:fibrous sheath CABYR-binding protein n=1 Tax=Tachyglossus aculeatus TaxID=9261 RepID=UPI0018F789DE|nr:fibrous sheath CABYR-binding protein [Tachyglossus aculeatus]
MDEGGEQDEPISAGKQETRRRRKLSQPTVDQYQQTDAIEKKKLGSARHSVARDTTSGQNVASKTSQTDHAPSGAEYIGLSSQLQQSWQRRKHIQDMVSEVQQTDKIKRERKKKPQKASPPLIKKESVIDVPPEPVIEVPQGSETDNKEDEEAHIQLEEEAPRESEREAEETFIEPEEEVPGEVEEVTLEAEEEVPGEEPEEEAPIPEPEEEPAEEMPGQPAEEARLEEEKPEEEPEVPLSPEESSFLINRSQQTSCTGDLVMELIYKATSKEMVDKWQQTTPSLMDVPKFVRHSPPMSQASISKTPEKAGPEAPAGEAAEAQGLDHIQGSPSKPSVTLSARGAGPEEAAAEVDEKPPETAAAVAPSVASVPKSPGEEAGSEASAVETELHPAAEAASGAPGPTSGTLLAEESGLDTSVAHVNPEAEVSAESPAAAAEGSASQAPWGGPPKVWSKASVILPQYEATSEAPVTETETSSTDIYSLGPEGLEEAPVAEEEAPVLEEETAVAEAEAPVDPSSKSPRRASVSEPADGDGPEAVAAE